MEEEEERDSLHRFLCTFAADPSSLDPARNGGGMMCVRACAAVRRWGRTDTAVLLMNANIIALHESVDGGGGDNGKKRALGCERAIERESTLDDLLCMEAWMALERSQDPTARLPRA